MEDKAVLIICFQRSHMLLQFSINRICLYRYPIVEPDYGHTKLRLSEQGLEAIRRIENPIAVVGVSW
jgi:hypothetical protein